MGFAHSRRTTYFATFIPLIVGCLLLASLSACSADTPGASANTPTPDSTVSATATAAETILIQKLTFAGQPSANVVSATTLEIDGKLKHGDNKQHDIYI